MGDAQSYPTPLFRTHRPFADPETAARKLLEIANATEAVQDGRIHIEKINGPMLFKEGVRRNTKQG